MAKSEYTAQNIHFNQQKGGSLCYQAIHQIQERIFNFTKLADCYSVNEIEIQNGQKLKTIFINFNASCKRVFYLGHGFGGTSLMYFPIFNQLLEKGNILLWELRGMGLSQKMQYPIASVQSAKTFYYQGLKKIISFYNHQEIIFISHSFGAYITLKFLIKNQHYQAIKKCILLSPIGVTPKQTDYKNKTSTCKDIFHHVVSWIGWKFNITYKSILKNLCKSLKIKIIQSSFQQYNLQGDEMKLMIDLFEVLTSIPGGSEKYFYKKILPRVLPMDEQSIQQEFLSNPVKYEIKFLYGDSKDWVDKQGAQYLSQHFQNISLRIIQDCGHMMPLQIACLRNIIKQQLQMLQQ